VTNTSRPLGALLNYYEHHLGDYLRDTAHLSMLEDGAYRRLLDLYYTREAPLPANLDAVCRLIRARSDDDKAAVMVVLDEFFVRTDEGYRLKRCDSEIDLFHEKVEKKRAAANARWASTCNAPAYAPAYAPAMQMECPPVSSLQSPDTSLQSKNKTQSADKPRAAKRMPADWNWSPEALRAIRAECPDVDFDLEMRRLRDYEFGRGRSDWDAVARNWMREEQKKARKNGKARPTRYEENRQRLAAWNPEEAITNPLLLERKP
jgi:uncharacterized protein YdaU (DUF1376 family)